MTLLTVATFVLGVVLFGLGYLLNRVGRPNQNDAVTSSR
jgi:hypothetical protein